MISVGTGESTLYVLQSYSTHIPQERIDTSNAMFSCESNCISSAEILKPSCALSVTIESLITHVPISLIDSMHVRQLGMVEKNLDIKPSVFVHELNFKLSIHMLHAAFGRILCCDSPAGIVVVGLNPIILEISLSSFKVSIFSVILVSNVEVVIHS
jgi:hypothetical protein